MNDERVGRAGDVHHESMSLYEKACSPNDRSILSRANAPD